MGGLSVDVLAQDETDYNKSALLEEVIVTARKRQEDSQDVPIAMTALNSDQLEALKIRSLSNLTVGIPNVSLDDVGTVRSTANFSIRGLGINSSIPSIDPTVGVFIDGVYMGQNTGILVDMFDVESVEVLRGPQGTLFGRNVTGGAVLISSKGPTEEFEFNAKIAVDGNPNGDGGLSKYYLGSISGPIGDTLGYRVSVYQNDDDGWFVNLLDGKDFGEINTTIFRPVLSWAPNDKIEMILRWEHLETDGDGPASQSHTNGRGVPGFFANFERDSFDFSIDDRGFTDLENDLVTFQTNWDVDFGEGTVTNIFGWRQFSGRGESDIDAQPVWLFHAPFWNDQEQYSNELRYNGQFSNVNVTTGVYWFTNEINYSEQRNLIGVATGGVAPALTQSGGGNYWVDSLAGFASVDINLTDNWILNAGIRYTDERKKAQIASLVRNVNKPCNVVVGGTCPFDFVDSKSWGAWSGKLGATYVISDSKRIYGSWTRADRSGGYNLRNTAIDTVNLGPGPFEPETVDSIEFGYKSEFESGGRLNVAAFYTTVSDMQREINLADAISGVVQVIKNTADAEIWGFEVSSTFAVGANTVIFGSVGYLNASYTKVFFDLNGDGVLDSLDKGLDLPRAPEWTYDIGLSNEIQLGSSGSLTSRISYAYRDNSAYTDNNLGYLLAQDIVDFGFDFRPTGDRWVASIYGRNMLNSVSHGGDTQLPNFLGPVPTGGTFAPLAKGRVLGFEVSFTYR
jgi:iron complex outermembrane receptor protein